MVSSHSHSSKDEALDESVVLMTRRFIRLSAKVNDKHLDGWLRSGLRRKIAALEHGLSYLELVTFLFLFGRVSDTRQYSVIGHYKLAEPSITFFQG